MAIENTLLGIAGIIIGILIFIKTGAIIFSLTPIILGIALIFFAKEEDKIEKRKDINMKKTKK